MLCLSRRGEQSLKIGDDVWVHVLEVDGKYVRLGVEAPRELKIERREINEAPGRESP